MVLWLTFEPIITEIQHTAMLKFNTWWYWLTCMLECMSSFFTNTRIAYICEQWRGDGRDKLELEISCKETTSIMHCTRLSTRKRCHAIRVQSLVHRDYRLLSHDRFINTGSENRLPSSIYTATSRHCLTISNIWHIPTETQYFPIEAHLITPVGHTHITWLATPQTNQFLQCIMFI